MISSFASQSKFKPNSPKKEGKGRMDVFSETLGKDICNKVRLQ